MCSCGPGRAALPRSIGLGRSRRMLTRMHAKPDADGVYDPLERLMDEIRGARQANAYTVALMATMALVDICGALTASNGRSTGAHFRAWFEANVAGATARLDPADAWDLRCGLLHQGHAHGAAYDHILFTLPTAGGVAMHGNIMALNGRSALNLDLRFLVDDILGAVERWWSKNKGEPVVAANAARLARIRENGMAPFILGVPLIA